VTDLAIGPRLSVVVVFHDMAREAARTLVTLSPGYQRGVTSAEYEVIAVDAGSAEPLDAGWTAARCPNARLIRTPRAPSPAAAVNTAAREAEGEAIAICIDGARMLSPGVVAGLITGLRAYPDPVVATLAWHLGPKIQNESILEGYDRQAEDRLLASVNWQSDGYELFRIATLAASSAVGWFRPIGESNCLAVRRSAWEALGGVDERFVSPGGGYANLDLYRRACERASDLVLLLGEGTFHQVHGGVATNTPWDRHPFLDFEAEYRSIRGVGYTAPTRRAVYLGGVPAQSLPFLAHSISVARSAVA